MNEGLPNKKIEVNSIESIKNTVFDSGEKICSFLGIQSNTPKDIMDNLVVKTKLSGHNNEIFIIDFYNTQTEFLGKACLKYSSDIEHNNGLRIESDILEILNARDVM